MESGVEMIEDRITEIEEKLLDFIHYEQQRENRLKKMNRASEICSTITKYLTFLSTESQN